MGHKKLDLVGNGAHKDRKNAKKSMTPKQIRARARRAGGLDKLTEPEKKAMMRKPLEEWDLEELARGRPKDKNGAFTGATPHWVTGALHQQAIEQFKKLMRADMQSHTVTAMTTIQNLMLSNEVDERGKPIVPAGVKADLAKFLVEHLLGKPTQPIQQEISITLQSILGNALVMPDQMAGYIPASSHRPIDEDIIDADEVDDE